MKMNFKLGNIEIEGKTKISDIEIGIQYAPGELKGEYELFKTIMRELPQTLKDVAEGAKTFEKLDKELSDIYEDDIKIESHKNVSEEEVLGKKAE